MMGGIIPFVYSTSSILVEEAADLPVTGVAGNLVLIVVT